MRNLIRESKTLSLIHIFFRVYTFLSVNLNDQVKTDEFAYWSAEYASKAKKIFENMETKIDKVYEICLNEKVNSTF